MVHVFLVKTPYLFFECLIGYMFVFRSPDLFSRGVLCLNVWPVFHIHRFFRNLKAPRLCDGTRCSNNINWLCKRWRSTSSHLQNSNYSHRHPTAHQATEGFGSLGLCHVPQQCTKADPKLQVLILKMYVVPIENVCSSHRKLNLSVSEFSKCKTIVNTCPRKTPKKIECIKSNYMQCNLTIDVNRQWILYRK